MARQMEFNLEVDSSINEIIDESGNSFIALRKLRWNPNSPFKIDLRKWFVSSTGEETAGKGVSFITDEGPSNLIQALLKHGYGDTIKTIEGIRDRDNFLPSVASVLSDDDMSRICEYMDENKNKDVSSSYYDPKSIFD